MNKVDNNKKNNRKYQLVECQEKKHKGVWNFKYKEEGAKEKESSYLSVGEIMDKIPNISSISNISLKINKFSGYTFKTLECPSPNSREYKRLLENIYAQTKNFTEEFQEQYHWEQLYFKTLDKLVIGLGGHSVFENDITLHHIYGMPYIPGQAIKGCLRNYIIKKCFGCKEEDAGKNVAFKYIFGSQKEHSSNNIHTDKGKNGDMEGHCVGKVIFLDAYPHHENFKFGKDVIATHYDSYYKSDNAMPVSHENPIINNFLVVQNCQFIINIGISRKIMNEKLSLPNMKVEGDTNTVTIKDILLAELKESFIYGGIGAKTSVGYGYFEEDKDLENQIGNIKSNPI